MHVYRPRHYCGDWLTFGCFVLMITDHNLLWRKVLVRWLPIMTSWRKDKQSWMLRSARIHSWQWLLRNLSVSCRVNQFFFFCNYSYVVFSFFLQVWTAVLLCRRTPAYYGRIVVKTLYTPAPTKSCAAFKNVCIHRCVQKCVYMYTRNIYFIFHQLNIAHER